MFDLWILKWRSDENDFDQVWYFNCHFQIVDQKVWNILRKWKNFLFFLPIANFFLVSIFWLRRYAELWAMWILLAVCVCVVENETKTTKKLDFEIQKKFRHFCCCSFHCCWLLLRFFVVVILKPIDNFLKLSSICDDQTNLVVVVDEIIQSSWI